MGANRSTAFVVGPYVKHHAVVSTHYATPNMLRTIEEVLGLQNLGVHDAGVPPMTDAFDTNQASWSFHATPALVLFNTQLPLVQNSTVNLASIPKPTHDAAWWEVRTKGFDFSQEDRIPRNSSTASSGKACWETGPIPQLAPVPICEAATSNF